MPDPEAVAPSFVAGFPISVPVPGGNLGERPNGSWKFPTRTESFENSAPLVPVSGGGPGGLLQYMIVDVARADSTRGAEAERLSDAISRYDDRIRVLDDLARADGFHINPHSRESFRAFVVRNHLMKQARLVLMDNGNLRATWGNLRDRHIGLQFLPDGMVQYVIFSRRASSRTISRVRGRDTLDGITKQVAALGLASFLGH